MNFRRSGSFGVLARRLFATTKALAHRFAHNIVSGSREAEA